MSRVGQLEREWGMGAFVENCDGTGDGTNG